MLGAINRAQVAGLHSPSHGLDDPSMAVPTVAGLCVRLDPQLAPAPGFTAPATPISAVHISELVDPTAYLSGGELLLTTGLALPRSTMGCERYVRRLVGAGVCALAIGLGPVHARVPAPLADACRAAGLPLLVVPEATPFLTVTKAYWRDLSRSAERQLVDVLATHQRLVDAALAADASVAVLRTLVRAVGRWAAVLGPGGELEEVWPAGAGAPAAALSGELDRLRVTGIRSAASLYVEDLHVSVYPLAVEERLVGYLAVGSDAPPAGNDRRLLLTASALLSIDRARRRTARLGSGAVRQSVPLLLDLGLPDAAVRLAARLGVRLGDRVRLLAVGTAGASRPGPEDLGAEEVRRWCADALEGPADPGPAWFVLPVDHPPLADLDATLRRRTPGGGVRLAVTGPVVLAGVPRARDRLLRGLERAPAGTGDTSELDDRLDRLLDGPGGGRGAETVATLVEYLRHRGQWEPTARALGVHRNTVRLRVARCREVLGDLDDPDLAAPLWLLLRDRGLTGGLRTPGAGNAGAMDAGHPDAGSPGAGPRDEHPDEAEEHRVDRRAELLPEERAAGSEDAHEQAAAILEESDERTQRPERTRDESTQTP